jgi:alginate O-acetyltransferase complex protein AlgI
VLAFTEKTKSKLAHVVTGVVYVAVFLLCVAYVVDSTYNPFLYFRF